jgi:hypothetical protein
MMGGKTRVSAVFLLALAIWVGSACGDDADRQGASARRPATKAKVGVGTETGPRQAEESTVAEQGEAVGARPWEVFREVEKGLRLGTPVPFEGYLGKGRIKLDFGEGGPRGGFFTKAQAFYLIGDYLKGSPTLEVRQIRASGENDRVSRPFALLERTCRHKNGPVGKEYVFVLLSLEADGWMITELRAVAAR